MQIVGSLISWQVEYSGRIFGHKLTCYMQTLIVLGVLSKLPQAASREGISNSAFRITSIELLPYIQLPERAIPADLSIVEIAMLIASKHLVEEERPFNFVIAYERYSDHCKRAAAAGTSSTRAFGRGLCLKVSHSYQSCLLPPLISARKGF